MSCNHMITWRIRAGVLILLVSKVFLAFGSQESMGYGAYVNDFACDVFDEDYSKRHYLEITLRNCNLVAQSEIEVGQAINDTLHELVDDSENQRLDWIARTAAAQAACEEARSLLQAQLIPEAANLSVNAWGSIIMQGKECCVLITPPYCLDKSWSSATVALLVPFGILLLLLVGALLASLRKQPRAEPMPISEDASKDQRRSAADGQRRRLLEGRLRDAWMSHSPLRVLPHSKDFAASAASLFAALSEVFSFQDANVMNQFEHFMSLLRSQVAMVADRSVGDGTAVNESGLLPEALGDLHDELLNGFIRWRRVFRDHPKAQIPEAKGLPKLCGVKWETLKREAAGIEAAELSRNLAEISALLLVWGEAGNVRFMPEVIYFLTELVLESDPAGEPHSVRALYQLQESELQIVNQYKSALFLSRIIRPIYNMVFDEWYDKVDVLKDSKRDAKKLRDGFDAFIPADVANYDDWNEFFATPDKMVEVFRLKDGKAFFEHAHGQRFKQLAMVDWKVTLEARVTKSHRELHSLWGVFASLHRCVFCHAILFFACLVAAIDEKDIPDSPDRQWVLFGQATNVRYAALGLLVPIHAFAWWFALFQVSGPAARPNCAKCKCFNDKLLYCRGLIRSFFKPLGGCPGSGQQTMRFFLWKPWSIFFLAPAGTYVLIRMEDNKHGKFDGEDISYNLLAAHFGISGFLAFHLLFIPNYRYMSFPCESTTHVPILLRFLRYVFWGAIFAGKYFLGTFIAKAVSDAITELEISRPGFQSWNEIQKAHFSTYWGSSVLRWLMFWSANFYLFFTDTALLYVGACAILGVITTLLQRHFARNRDLNPLVAFVAEDAVAKVPQRFSKKVLAYAPAGNTENVSAKFPLIWDRIVEYMRYEDKMNNTTMGNLSYDVMASGHQVYWEDLSKPMGEKRDSGTGTQAEMHPSMAGERMRVRVPNIFKQNTTVEGCLKTYRCVPDMDWPPNTDVQWRITALARGLGLPMPRPYRAPYIPGLTVLIPHYLETILMQKRELFQGGKNEVVPLIDWLTHRYRSEFEDFTSRMQARQARGDAWPVVGTEWDRYTDSQWPRVCNWAAMRQQTLFRTVAGMCYYHPALQAHFELQGDKNASLAGVWDAADVFTCMISMQMYAFFDRTMLEHTNFMLDKFPRCLKVAFIDFEDKGIAGDKDNVHLRQKRRYFSCLIDRSSPKEGLKRKPHFRIELPGYPILGDGKGDNQNHAIPFMRGHYSQCIDANQGAYFEQMLLLPNALGEFRSKKRGDHGGKKIIGFPEHITSDIGSIGDFAASAEVAFGTILQRTYAVLGARMHYGHPDIMNKLYMIQQGGVSKATKTINLSEDIFAGMDFTLRGDGRTIKHCEYFNLAKGRDLGFNTVLGFFSKLSSGTGEQILSRQTFRLGQVLQLPEFLSFYYAHGGYYLSQFFISWALPVLVFLWLLVLLGECDDNFASYQQCESLSRADPAEVMASLLATCYSWIMLIFIFATMFPLFMELWMQRNLGFAVCKVIQSYLTFAPVLFIFQAKCIGHYVVNEFRYGGATYVATGRGLPTERRPFIGEPEVRKRTIKCEAGDLKCVVDPRGKVRSVEDGGQAKRVGIMPGHVISRIDDMPFSAEKFKEKQAKAGKAYTLELRAGFLMLRKYGGLYLDYAVISYYDGVTLLFGFGMVIMAGGTPTNSLAPLAFMFLSVAVSLVALLYGPFIFNPYQFEARHFCDDLRAFLAFFLQDSGRHWVDWYDRTQLKKGCGLATTLVDITFFGFIFVVAAWYSAVNLKVHALVTIFTKYQGFQYLYIAVLVPPVVISFLFTAMVALLEVLGGCASTTQQNLEKRMQSLRAGQTRKSKDKETDDLEDAPRVKAGAKAEDVVVKAAPARANTIGCSVGVPLPLSAICVVVMDLAEAAFFLQEFYWVGWTRALLAGLILKLALLQACVSLGEGVLVSRTFERIIKFSGALGLPLATWVRAHRMFRDILTALIIFLPQVVFVMLNQLNQCLCPTCNAHQLLLYRDPGHIPRSELELAAFVEAPDDGSLSSAPPGTGGSGPSPGSFGIGALIVPTKSKDEGTSSQNSAPRSPKPPGSPKPQSGVHYPRQPGCESAVGFQDDKGENILLKVNEHGGVDFFYKDVKTLKELTVVQANGRHLHLEGRSCGRWSGSWDFSAKPGDEEYVRRAVCLFRGEPANSSMWGAFTHWSIARWFTASDEESRR